MLGLMQDWPLLCHRIIDHAAIQHGNREVVTRSIEGPIHRTNYRDIRKRALQVAQRLEREGVKLGDRVATLAWNTWRHLETWYGITGVGAVYHTINPRLFPEQIAYIANHAEDRLMFLDTTFVPLIEKLQDKLPTIRRYVILTDAAHMPQTSLRNAVAYEDWIAEADGDFTWAAFEENTACGMCYTSGHHRQSEGRRLLAPLQRAALDDGADARRVRPLGAGHHHAGGAVLSRQWLDHRVLGAAVGLPAGAARHEARRRLDLRTARGRAGHHDGRGADHLADAACPHGGEQPEALDLAPGADRRLGLSARHDREVREELRRDRRACLGHDRDESDRLDLRDQARL